MASLARRNLPCSTGHYQPLIL